MPKIDSFVLFQIQDCEKHIIYLLLRYLRNGLYSRIGISVKKKHITDPCWIVSMDLFMELLGQIHCGVCISIRDIICYLLERNWEKIMSYGTHLLENYWFGGKGIFGYFLYFVRTLSRRTGNSSCRTCSPFPDHLGFYRISLNKCIQLRCDTPLPAGIMVWR